MIGRRSSFILLAVVDQLQTKTKGHKDQSNINAMNQLKKKSLFVEYIIPCKKHLSFDAAPSQKPQSFNEPGGK